MKICGQILAIVSMIFLSAGLNYGQDSGSIWIITNKPGSADFSDDTIDQQALAFLDSLMQRDDIAVTFLGAADNLPWKGMAANSKISQAIDQAKKLERALALRNRYGKGEVGVTDELARGVKVIWSPKPPDVFQMREDVNSLRATNDSLSKVVANFSQRQESQLAALQDSLAKMMSKTRALKEERIEPVFADWEVKTGFLAWTGGASYDLAVPSVGISLKRLYWAFEIIGGFTPWSREDAMGSRGDAMLLGTITLFPRNKFGIRSGAFSGWEFLTKTDNWTMKVLGLTAGPEIKWKFFEAYLGYTFSRLSTLVESDQWNHGFMFQFNFKFLLN